jgi:hypothetical protein
MSDFWQTIEQAAVTLGLSVRTVNRHITAGKLESRLFEGRREVRIPTSAAFASAASGNDGQSSASFSTRSGASASAADTSSDTASTDPVDAARATAIEDNGETEGSSSDGARFASATRQRVTADVSSDRPMDLQTMLALADSLDDKATLAVAAYQTLARTAESQVQSLRRVAFGAWAAVGVIAVGVIIAVGWGTYRLTTAEVTASNLREQVNKQDKQIQDHAAGRDEELQRLIAERDAAKQDTATTKEQMARIQGRIEVLTEQTKAAEANAILAAAVLRQQGSTTQPTTQPTGGHVSSATQPAVADASANPPAGGSATRPIAKLPVPLSPKSTYMTNSAETFDPK